MMPARHHPGREHVSLVETLSSCLGPEGAARLRAIAEGFGPYRTYVSRPQQSGVGRGLVRRHDALINHVSGLTRAGRSETLAGMAARINLFRQTWAEGDAVLADGCEVLLNHPAFIDGARRLSGRPIAEPCMLYANVLLPGQELPIHTDSPAFHGLDQTNTPEWLLVCMAHSGLFAPWRVPMIGAVTFLGGCEGGDFVTFPDGPDAPATRTPATDDTAVLIDAETVFHGVGRVGGADHPAPPTGGTEVAREAGDRWVLRGANGDLATYRWGELRFSLQWKARCHHEETAGAPALTRADAESMLIDDLRERGVLADPLPDETQTALRMIETYIRFPPAALD